MIQDPDLTRASNCRKKAEGILRELNLADNAITTIVPGAIRLDKTGMSLYGFNGETLLFAKLFTDSMAQKNSWGLKLEIKPSECMTVPKRKNDVSRDWARYLAVQVGGDHASVTLPGIINVNMVGVRAPFYVGKHIIGIDSAERLLPHMKIIVAGKLDVEKIQEYFGHSFSEDYFSMQKVAGFMNIGAMR